MAAGRPSDYNLELAKKICRLIATSNKGLKQICAENDDLPTQQTVFEWRLDHDEFAGLYARAKCQQVEFLVDEIITISDEASKDHIITEAGKKACNAEYLNRSRLRVDTRKWIAAKLAPRLYGDRTVVEQTTTHKLDEVNVAELEEAKKAHIKEI